MAEKIIVRRCSIKDVDAIFNIGLHTKELQFSKKINFHEKTEFIEWIKHPRDNIFLVALAAGKIDGFLYAKIVSREWCILDNIAVDKFCRHMGIGTKLLEKLYTLLKRKKVSYVQALVEEHQRKTREFWRERGFRQGKIFVWYEKELK